MNPNLRTFSLAAACFALSGTGSAIAGEFSVNPIRIELGASARSGVIAIKNEDKQKLSFQIDGKEWTQDAAGQDQYADTDALIFFPKIMSVEPGATGLIRVGAKAAAVPTEKTYRLFIEEMPGATKKLESSGAQINVLIRFGAPVFIAPLKPQDSLDIESFGLTKGNVTIAAKNTGNRHQVVQGIELKGTDAGGNDVYALTLADRYLLTGSAKTYTTTIPANQCAKITQLSLEFKTDKLSVARKLSVSHVMCP
ncbi:fimbrial chaperone protein [Polaromonas sp. OV174]|uniref:fimbrial biogenesis chaperone n=1 Tax=Polaromonas sp. OV174 TaxID=1855300 RepID=UPI0008EEE4AA|nr:fimbria/pilus periplasmic chaperone [Polaromonas sp. OV174]SFC14917.1 fimbrial chaperone protein [Polaromonas sp. OV174]